MGFFNFLRKINALSTWIAGKANFDAGLFRAGLGVDEVSCVSYDEFVEYGKTRWLASSPSVVGVHTKTRSRST